MTKKYSFIRQTDGSRRYEYALFPNSKQSNFSKGTYQTLGEWDSAESLINDAATLWNDMKDSPTKRNKSAIALLFLWKALTDKIVRQNDFIPDYALAAHVARDKYEVIISELQSAGENGLSQEIQTSMARGFRGYPE